MKKVVNLDDYRKTEPTISQLLCIQMTTGLLKAIKDGLAKPCIEWNGKTVYIDINDVYSELAERGE